jgi:DNA-binding winged helix-turn-helix (wHTH) protein
MRPNTSCCATARLSHSHKSFDLLLALVERHGHLLEKEELLKTVWPDTFVEEANLASNISQLRKALGDGENGHRYIETAPKRGYSFIEVNGRHSFYQWNLSM